MCVDTAGSIPRAAFYIPVVQVMEQRSPKPQAAGLSPAGNAICVPCEGAAQIAGHLAAKVPDAAAPDRFTPIHQTECTGAAYMPS